MFIGPRAGEKLRAGWALARLWRTPDSDDPPFLDWLARHRQTPRAVERYIETAGFYRDMSDAVATERAVGAIMQTNQCSADEARRIVDSASRHRNVSPREVAESLPRALVVEDAPDPADDDPGRS